MVSCASRAALLAAKKGDRRASETLKAAPIPSDACPLLRSGCGRQIVSALCARAAARVLSSCLMTARRSDGLEAS
jgi:hypothetical protein